MLSCRKQVQCVHKMKLEMLQEYNVVPHTCALLAFFSFTHHSCSRAPHANLPQRDDLRPFTSTKSLAAGHRAWCHVQVGGPLLAQWGLREGQAVVLRWVCWASLALELCIAMYWHNGWGRSTKANGFQNGHVCYCQNIRKHSPKQSGLWYIV